MTIPDDRNAEAGAPAPPGADASSRLTIIEAPEGWQPIDFRELWRYRDLFYFLVTRQIKGRYAQSVLGVGWALIQPIMSMVVYTVVFGNLANVGSEGVPYAIFSYTALVPWTYFSSAMSDSSASLVSNAALLKKVYVPRLVLPLSSVLGRLVDFVISLSLVGVLMLYFQVTPTVWVLTLPLLILLMMLTAAGLGMWMAALAVQYRDVKHALTFVVQLLMYAAPVVYPLSLIPERFRLVYSLNPMVGVIEGFRAALLGTRPMPWDLIGLGAMTTMLLLISGMYFFRRSERVFADVA